MTNTDNTTQTVVKTKRIKYGFELTFPKQFTIRDLRKAKSHKVKYITIYSRVKRALEEGTIVEAGLKDPDHTRRGRKETIYRLASEQVVDAPVATADVAVPSAANW
jgi:hypothetical protein